MKKLFVLVVALVSLVSLVACQSEQTGSGTGYGLVHQAYVGVATVKVEKGVIKEATFDEYFLPAHIAQIAGYTVPESGLPADVVTGDSHGPAYFHKYVKVGDYLFEGKSNATGEPVYASASKGVSNIVTWVAVSENAKYYYDQAVAEKIYIADSTGARKGTTLTGDAYDKWISKYDTSDWNDPTTWAATTTNYGSAGFKWGVGVQSVLNYVIDTKGDWKNSDVTKVVGTPDHGGADEDVFKVGDAVTGATLVDFVQYLDVIKNAYSNVK
jgi:hypothetical protein